MNAIKREVGFWLRCGTLATVVGVAAWLFVQLWRNVASEDAAKNVTVRMAAVPSDRSQAGRETEPDTNPDVGRSSLREATDEQDARSLTVKWVSPIPSELERGGRFRISARGTKGGAPASIELCATQVIVPDLIDDGSYVLDNTPGVDFLGSSLNHMDLVGVSWRVKGSRSLPSGAPIR
jgi:hypothetical protein